jgi:hypothetical protein
MRLAQRLLCVLLKAQFVPWTAVKEQFGCNYGRMYKFKDIFR